MKLLALYLKNFNRDYLSTVVDRSRTLVEIFKLIVIMWAIILAAVFLWVAMLFWR